MSLALVRRIRGKALIVCGFLIAAAAASRLSLHGQSSSSIPAPPGPPVEELHYAATGPMGISVGTLVLSKYARSQAGTTEYRATFVGGMPGFAVNDTYRSIVDGQGCTQTVDSSTTHGTSQEFTQAKFNYVTRNVEVSAGSASVWSGGALVSACGRDAVALLQFVRNQSSNIVQSPTWFGRSFKPISASRGGTQTVSVAGTSYQASIVSGSIQGRNVSFNPFNQAPANHSFEIDLAPTNVPLRFVFTNDSLVGKLTFTATLDPARSLGATLSSGSCQISSISAPQGPPITEAEGRTQSAAAGQTLVIGVSATSQCAWTASSTDSWITIQSVGSGTGNGTVQAKIAPNATAAPRSGSLRIGGKTLFVDQAFCTGTISPKTSSAPTGPSTVTLRLTAPSGCPWMASTSATWATFVSSASGTSTADLTVSLLPNTTSLARSVTVNAAGDQATIVQAGSTSTLNTAPTLLGPGNNTTGSLPEVFSWSSVPSAASYTIQADRSSAFTNPYTVNTQGTSITLSAGLQVVQNSSGIYWRVAAVSSSGAIGPYSAARLFNFGAASPITSFPSPLGPAQGSILTGAQVDFSWTAVTNATKYRLTITRGAQTLLIPDLTGTTYPALLPVGSYDATWTVSAGNTAGYGPESRSSTFQMQSTAGPSISSVVVDYPSEGGNVQQGGDTYAIARFTGDYNGTVSGYWLVDGTTRTNFQVVRSGLNNNQIQLNLSSLAAGSHNLQVAVESPNGVQSAPRTFRVATPVSGPARSIRLRSDQSIIFGTGFGLSDASLTAELVDDQGRRAVSDSRTVAFRISSGSQYANLTTASMPSVNGVATSRLVAALNQSGLVTVTAESSGLTSDSVTIVVGDTDLRNLVSDYLTSLSHLDLPLDFIPSAGFTIPTKSYAVSAARQTLNSLDTTKAADFEAAQRLKIISESLYRLYGNGIQKVPAGKGAYAGVGVGNLVSSAASNAGLLLSILMDISKTIASVNKYSAVSSDPASAEALKAINKFHADVIGVGIDVGAKALPPDLKKNIELGMAAMKDYVTYKISGDLGTAANKLLLKTATNSIAQEVWMTAYVTQTQTVLDSVTASASARRGTPPLDTFRANVESLVNDSVTKAEAAQVLSQSVAAVGGDWDKYATWTATILRPALAQKNLLGATLLANYLTAELIPAYYAGRDGILKPIQLIGDITASLPTAAAANTTSLSDSVTTPKEMSAVSRLASSMGVSPSFAASPLQARAANAYSAARSDYEALTTSILDKLQSNQAGQIGPLAVALSVADDALATSVNLTAAPIRATAPFSSYLTPSFSNSYDDALRLSHIARGFRAQFLLAVADVGQNPSDNAKISAAVLAGQQALTATAIAADSMRNAGTLSLGNPNSPFLAVTNETVPAQITVGVPFQISVHVVNSGGTAAQDVSLEVASATGVAVAKNTNSVGLMPPGDERDLTWQVTITDSTQDSVVLTVKPASSNGAAQSRLIILSVTGGTSLPRPVFSAAGTTNAASGVSGLVPGGIGTIYGTGLTNATGIVSGFAPPLPTNIAGTTVTLNGIPAPLFAVAKVGTQEQINFQVPYEIAGQTSATVVVTNNGQSSVSIVAPVYASQPGIFTSEGSTGIVVHSTTNQLVTPANPALPGEVLVAYATSLGPVTPAPATGAAPKSSPLSYLNGSAVVTIGGIPAKVLFAGLTPGFAGLFQVNTEVPSNALNGTQDLVVSVGTAISAPVKLSVKGAVGAPAKVAIVSGNNQTVLQGQPFPQPLVIIVTDSQNQPIANEPVYFSINNTPFYVASTDSNGRAQAPLGLPTVNGLPPGPLAVLAVVGSGPLPPPPGVPFATFSLGVGTGIAGSVQMLAGDQQTTAPGQPFPQPLAVQVRDTAGSPMSGAAVTWVLAEGSATLSSTSTNTDSLGRAQISVTAGSVLGPVYIRAQIAGGGPVFSLSVRPVLLFTSSIFSNAASGAVGLVPCGIATVQAAGLAPNVVGIVSGQGFGPLPYSLAGVSISINGLSAPIQSVSNQNAIQQANFQTPCETSSGVATATISVSGVVTTVPGITVYAAQPGVFSYQGPAGKPYASVIRVVDGSYATPANPLRRGEDYIVLVTGLGQTTPPAVTNAAGSNQNVVAQVVVGVNNAGVSVSKAQYLSGSIGTYAIQFQVPLTSSVGIDVPFSVLAIVNGQSVFSNPSLLPGIF